MRGKERFTPLEINVVSGEILRRIALMCRKQRFLTGFTLIELMLVVIIIGVLSAMVVPRLVGRSEQARMAAARADIESNIAMALDLYELDNGTYPPDLNSLMYEPSPAPPNWNGPYLKRKPKDPWGEEYKYKFPGEQNKASYDLWSFGRDKVAGGGDDITNWEETE